MAVDTSFQECKDEALAKSFTDLHKELVDRIASWCKEHNVSTEYFHLSGDGFGKSCEYGSWVPCTDSSFSLENKDKNGRLTHYLFSI